MEGNAGLSLAEIPPIGRSDLYTNKYNPRVAGLVITQFGKFPADLSARLEPCIPLKGQQKGNIRVVPVDPTKFGPHTHPNMITMGIGPI